MTIDDLIKNKFVGNRLISCNGRKVNEIISKVELESGHLSGPFLVVYLKNKTKVVIFPKYSFELEETGA